MAVSRLLSLLWWSEMVRWEFICVLRKNVQFNTVSVTGKDSIAVLFLDNEAQVAGH
jgi:hypothetical protein